MEILLVVGTRPQIVKSVPVIREAKKTEIELKIVHTGQHYDYDMSDVFFENFSVRRPVVNLGIGSGTHGYQTGETILRLERFLGEERPDLVLVPGDTNSALGAAIAAAKMHIPLAHIEAGARSYSMEMQEEINRRIIDHVSSLLFAVSDKCKENLSRESVLGEVIISGDTMYDIYKQSLPKIEDSEVVNRFTLSPRDYLVLTLHREENVENSERLKNIMQAITSLKLKVVFPIHPRTNKTLQSPSVSSSNLMIVEPLDYFSMMKLVRESLLVLTDSGGLQKEAFWSNVPCITLRDETEWGETVKEGANRIVGASSVKIKEAVNFVIQNYDNETARMRIAGNPYYFGGAGRIITKGLTDFLKRS
jgi:UDP-N-acetylglucosamine 2-epimerase